MSTTMDQLRGELERLFDLDDLKKLSDGLLGYGPDEVGGSNAKGAFARALVERCEQDDAIEALADAILLSAGDRDVRPDVIASAFAAGPEEMLSPGATVAGYKVIKKIGEGGLGVVYLGEQRAEGEKPSRVAIKVIRPAFARNRAAVQRYLTVSRAFRGLDVPGLAPIVDVGRVGDAHPWVAWRFIEGQSLATRVARVGPMHFREALPVMRGVLEALDALHARGLVHGDVKAENVFIVRPPAKEGEKVEATGVLLDFGTDRLLSQAPVDANTTGILPIFGTAKAIDPQLARGHGFGAHTDLYAAGAMLYEVLAGRPPFIGDSAIDVVAKHLWTEAEAPSTHAPRGWVPSELDAVVLKALAKEPAERYPSATALLRALETATVVAAKIQKTDLDKEAFAQAAEKLRKKPQDGDLAAKLEQIVEPAHAWKEALAVYAEAAEAVESLEVKKGLLFRIARIHETELADHAESEAAYRRVLELDSEDAIARAGIEELKRSSGDVEGLVEILIEKTEREETADGRAGILREVATLYDQKLDSKDNAFVAWVQVLTEDPKDHRAAREIERLATSPGQWTDAITSLSEAAQHYEDPNDAVHLYVVLGRWYAEHLKRPDFALQCFSKALELDPSHGPAYDGTILLYERAQTYNELVTVLLSRADITKNPAQARDIKAEAAEVVLKKLNDSARAAQMLSEVLQDDPAHPRAADTLAVVYADRGEWRELVKILERRSHNEGLEAKVKTAAQIAEIYEDRLDDLEKATLHYQQALSQDAFSLPALKGLERIYARDEKYAELLQILEKQLELAATPRQKIGLYERIGSLQEEEFVDREKATEAFEAIIEVEPNHDGANAALARLYRAQQRFDELAATFERHAKGTEDQNRKVELMLGQVRVLMTDVGAPERAMEACERILAVDPQHAEALERLAQLKAKTGDAAAALEAIEQLARGEKDTAKRSDLWLRAGRLLEEKGDRDGAIERLKRSLDDNEKNTEAAADLRAIYGARGDAHGAADLLMREIKITEGASAQAKLYAELGTLRAERLHDAAKAREAFEHALTLDSTCSAASLGLGHLAAQGQDYEQIARHYEPLLSRTAEMDPVEAREVCLKCGDAFRALGNLDKAQRAYLNAKAFAPDDRDVLERVADVAFEAGPADEAAELYRDLRERFRGKLEAAEKGKVLYRLGESLRLAGALDEAVAPLNEAAEILSEDPAPLTSLEQVYEAQGQWEQAVRTMRRRMEQAGDDERFELLVKVGDVLLEKVGDRAKASKSYVAALEVKPDDRNLLTKLMAVYSESKDWSRLVEVVLRIAELVDDPRQLAKYYNTAASISAHEIGRIDEACDYYEQALEHDPTLANAFEGLIKALQRKQDWSRLADVYRAQLDRVAGTAPPEKRVALWDALGDVLHHKLDAIADAVDAYQEAQELDRDNRQRVEVLTEIYAKDPKRYFQKAVRTHAILLSNSPYRVESYQALRRLYAAVGKNDEVYCLCQTLAAMNMADPEEAAIHKAKRAKSPAAAQEFFNEEIWFNHVIHAQQDPLLTGIFAAITPTVLAVQGQPAATFGLDGANAIDAEHDEAAMARTLHYVAGVTQLALPPTYYRKDDPGGLSFVFTNPPGVGLGQGALAGGPSQALAFVAGRHLSYLRPGHFLRHLVPSGSGLRGWLLAAIKLGSQQFPVPADLRAKVYEHLASFEQHLLPKDRDKLTSLVHKLLAAAPELDMRRWVAAIDMSADRVGFVLANDLSLACAVIKASPEDAAAIGQKERLKELYLYAVSEEYLQLRQKLGIAITG